MSEYYILDDNNKAIPADTLTWAKFFESKERQIVKQEYVAGHWVSTVFLGLDHQWGEGPPLIFETMVFSTWNSSEQWVRRGSTWEEAEVMHEMGCSWARQNFNLRGWIIQKLRLSNLMRRIWRANLLRNMKKWTRQLETYNAQRKAETKEKQS